VSATTVFAKTVSAETAFPLARPDAPRRHGWAWLASDWPRHLRTPLPPDDEARVRAWSEAGHPVVVAGRGCGDGDDDVRLGLATPDKTRIALHLARAGVARLRPAPTLEEVNASLATVGWRDSLRVVAEVCRPAGLKTRVYGSVAWTHWSGLSFLRPGSDVDLLLEIGPESRLPRIDAALRSLLMVSDGPRLDGELVLPGGLAVAWREWAARPAEVLVKGCGAPRLVPRRNIVRKIKEQAV
jgi:phosphoribosyl-dephospho-CoA transferase